MTNERNSIWLILGPVIAMAFIASAILSDTNSTLFVFSVTAAVAYMLVPPVIQITLLATERFAERDGLVCAVALHVTAAMLLALFLMGVFNAG